MLTLEERADLLVKVAELHRSSAFRELVDLLGPLSEQQILLEPHLGYSLVLGFYHTDQYESALRLNQMLTARARGRTVGNLYCKHLVLEGVLHVEYGDLLAAEASFREAVTYATRSHDHWVLADLMMNLGILAWIGCRWDESLASFQRALAEHSILGHRYAVAACHQNLAMAYRDMNLSSESDSHFEQAHQLFASAETDRSNELSLVESERALLISKLGDHERAEALARRALSRVAHAGALRRQAEVLRVLGIIAVRRGLIGEGRAHLQNALTLSQQFRIRLLEAEVCEEMSASHRLSGDVSAAHEWAANATRIYQTMGAHAREHRTRIADGANVTP
jgi:tetratricopeptide (TPR) repeat protein